MAGDGKIDPSSPFYLGAGDQPGNLITHVTLKEDNYLAWSKAITLSMRSCRKEEEVMHQFFIGFDDDLHATVRTNLLSQQPPPDLNRAYQAFLQKEGSRGIAKGKTEKNAVRETHVFAISNARWKGAMDRPDKSKLYCSHCKKERHANEG
uniref:Retrotransposon Copia-like N-terminal domain-containing protein n=1 Tax=Chenopodium quinoa TaxID=63459 RepID=A0A803MNM4_CHEQI